MLGEPIRDRRAERHEATRGEIINAAWTAAREQGLAGISLRDIARRVGMQAPSLYSYVTSKNDIYDAMFAQAWTDCRDHMRAVYADLPDDPRPALKQAHHAFFDWVVSDPARYLLMGQRTIPNFDPSPEAYQPAIECVEDTRTMLAAIGVTKADDVDLNITLSAGLCAQQTANEPGGTRWKRLVDPVVDMFCDAVGIPPSRPRRATSRGKR